MMKLDISQIIAAAIECTLTFQLVSLYVHVGVHVAYRSSSNDALRLLHINNYNYNNCEVR